MPVRAEPVTDIVSIDEAETGFVVVLKFFKTEQPIISIVRVLQLDAVTTILTIAGVVIVDALCVPKAGPEGLATAQEV